MIKVVELIPLLFCITVLFVEGVSEVYILFILLKIILNNFKNKEF